MSKNLLALITNFKGQFADGKNRALYFFSNPILIGLFISIMVIFFLPPIFNKYSVKLINKTKILKKQYTYYVDLDNDGISEKVFIDTNVKDKVSLVVFKNDKVVEQWNFSGSLLDTDGPFWNDINGDGQKELFIFTLNKGKIILDCLTPLKDIFVVKDRIITQYLTRFDRLDGSLYIVSFSDQDNDGIKEVYFCITTGFAVSPRRMFAFNVKKNTLLSSPQSCAPITSFLTYKSDKNKLNFILATDAVGNCNDSSAYSDKYAWLMTLNPGMTFITKPETLGVYPSHSKISPFTSGKKKRFIAMIVYYGTHNYPPTISIYNSNLERIKERKFNYSSDAWDYASIYYDQINNPDYFFLIKSNGTIEKLDENLRTVQEIRFPPIIYIYHSLDVDNDDNDELIYQTKDLENIVIARNDFSNYLLVNCQGAGEIEHCSLKLNGNNPPELFVQFDNYYYTLAYQSNILYYLKYPLYFGIYILSFLLIFIIQKSQKHRAELKFATEKRIAELQMRSIKNQVDPHFTLNILNSIGSLFYKQDRYKADYLFGKYSKLLRQTILNSDKIVTTLSEELEYVKDYLELEQFRCNNKFSYNIKIEENVNLNTNIPKMLIHTFVENAIKHGIKHLEKKGKILISVTGNKDKINISIMDNGIGRQKSKEMELDNTGKGLGIIQQILDLYYNLMNTKITYTIKDMFDENNNANGTEISIDIPNK